MNKRIKQMWVGALRSGEFEQTWGALARRDSLGLCYCALGVLCELYRRDVGDNAPWEKDEYENKFRFLGYDSTLPPLVREWAGLDAEDPAVQMRGGLSSVSQINDIEGLSFNEIATEIECSRL